MPRSVAGATVPAFVERAAPGAPPRPSRAGVAGATVPAFVERGERAPVQRRDRGVAGATVPAFVERTCLSSSPGRGTSVLPGLRSRPSLSGALGRVVVAGPPAVLPGLRSRPSLSGLVRGVAALSGPVLPGLRSRPSLSAGAAGRQGPKRLGVLPGLRSRPSLSGHAPSFSGAPKTSVAGATVPAFVERASRPGGADHGQQGCCRGYGPGLR